MLQITLTVCAQPDKVMEVAQRLEREGLAKILERTPNIILSVPEQTNEEVVIAALAGLARKGLVAEFRSVRVK